MAAFRGSLDFCSNFSPYPVTTPDGIRYPTAEHCFQAQKSEDKAEREKIRLAATPGQAKHRGRTVVYLRKDWEQIKIDVMRTVVRTKFQQNREAASRLLSTGSGELVEHNEWHDNFWGSCSCSRCGGHGQNWLGKILMEIRQEIAGEPEVPINRYLSRFYIGGVEDHNWNRARSFSRAVPVLREERKVLKERRGRTCTSCEEIVDAWCCTLCKPTFPKKRRGSLVYAAFIPNTYGCAIHQDTCRECHMERVHGQYIMTSSTSKTWHQPEGITVKRREILMEQI